LQPGLEEPDRDQTALPERLTDRPLPVAGRPGRDLERDPAPDRDPRDAVAIGARGVGADADARGADPRMGIAVDDGDDDARLGRLRLRRGLGGRRLRLRRRAVERPAAPRGEQDEREA
jgi:hypothetical protein